MKVYTKKGDQGETALTGGTPIAKSDDLLEAYGSIDELNAAIGLVLSEETDPTLQVVQHRLFAVGGMLATEPTLWDKYWKGVDWERYTSDLEQAIDLLSEHLDPVKGFILPQGNRLIAQTQMARTICRRAERRIAKITPSQAGYLPLLKYINRLSDFLFILARFWHKTKGKNETIWNTTL